MPLFTATHTTEHETLIEWVDVALTNARSTVHGMDIHQLRATPIPSSELSLGWLLLHIGDVAEQWCGRAAAGPAEFGTDLSILERYERAFDSHRIAPDATAESVLAEYDRRCAHTLELLRSADLDAAVPVPAEMPWFPADLPEFNGRWVAQHVLGEINRHSGHADILREAIDGGTMYDLIARDQNIDMSYIGAWFAAHPEIPAPWW